MAGTFNVSSCTIFVAAAAGIAVAKHGNRAVTSKCGSADVLAALGAQIELSPDAARRCLEKVGVTFFFAPLYHPAFKVIAPVRRKLARRTIFNILGPLSIRQADAPTHRRVRPCAGTEVRRGAPADRRETRVDCSWRWTGRVGAELRQHDCGIEGRKKSRIQNSGGNEHGTGDLTAAIRHQCHDCARDPCWERARLEEGDCSVECRSCVDGGRGCGRN